MSSLDIPTIVSNAPSKSFFTKALYNLPTFPLAPLTAFPPYLKIDATAFPNNKSSVPAYSIPCIKSSVLKAFPKNSALASLSLAEPLAEPAAPPSIPAFIIAKGFLVVAPATIAAVVLPPIERISSDLDAAIESRNPDSNLTSLPSFIRAVPSRE